MALCHEGKKNIRNIMTKKSNTQEQYLFIVLVGERISKYRLNQHNPAHLAGGLVDEDNFSAVTKGERRCGLFGGGDAFLF